MIIVYGRQTTYLGLVIYFPILHFNFPKSQCTKITITAESNNKIFTIRKIYIPMRGQLFCSRSPSVFVFGYPFIFECMQLKLLFTVILPFRNKKPIMQMFAH